MGTLLDLITRIGNPAPKPPALRLVETPPRQTAAETPQAPASTPTPEPAQERTAEADSEPRRTAWQVARGGKPICNMVMSAPATHAEALAEARWRWPDADILEEGKR